MIKEAFINLFRGGDKYEEFWALKDIAFSVQRGESMGIIGRNGSGKSTLFKLISGVMLPAKGEIKVTGKISPLIELGAGLHPELTGLENIYLNGAIYGMNKKEVEGKLDEIINFSGLGQFIYYPIRTYSSGMYARLGFSLAINVNADILLVDEVLSVGDAEFQERCFGKINQLKHNGITIIYISHNLKSVINLCDTAIWLDNGEIKKEGNPQTVVKEYLKTA
ncbi:MAG: ABC transporter ATP-binding protein [Deltaproteobacteria bacterium]|nr:ABC transporter ATP-binding protein [Deltaproteobacteria bacterium]